MAKIILPEDRPIRLHILSMATVSVMYNKHTGTAYQLEVAHQEINSLSKVTRDLQTGKVRDLAAKKRAYGRIQDIPDERILKRPPNWFVAFVALFSILAIVSYGQYNQVFKAQVFEFWNANSGVIIVGGLVFMAMLLYLWLRRRRRAK